MDSMRSLNTSLPTSTPHRPVPPEQLLQAFKTAALSVTNLYKTAVTDQSSARQTGYQDALDDLLTFLDKEDLGLQDGEGWKVRQWATERCERSTNSHPVGESDDDTASTEKRVRSSSPVTNSKTSQDHNERLTESGSMSPPRRESAPPPTQTHTDAALFDRQPIFRSTATQPVPSHDTHMHLSETLVASQQSHTSPTVETPEPAPIRVEVVNRGSRTPHRQTNPRHSTRSSNRDFTFTSGTKRKVQFPDFFDIDISSFGNGRDGLEGGGKRGRIV